MHVHDLRLISLIPAAGYSKCPCMRCPDLWARMTANAAGCAAVRSRGTPGCALLHDRAAVCKTFSRFSG